MALLITANAIVALLCCLCVACLVAGAAYVWQMAGISDVGIESLPFTIVTDTPDTNGDETPAPRATREPNAVPTTAVDLNDVHSRARP